MPDDDRGSLYGNTFTTSCGCNDDDNMGGCDCGCRGRNGTSPILLIILLLIIFANN